jgi:tRNA(Arg) A34 adenosine deaminase TadA
MAEQHGAVVVAGGKTLATGFNNLQPTHNRDFGCWQHAEVSALMTLKRRVQRREKDRVRGLCSPYKDRCVWQYPNHEF